MKHQKAEEYMGNTGSQIFEHHQLVVRNYKREEWKGTPKEIMAQFGLWH